MLPSFVILLSFCAACPALWRDYTLQGSVRYSTMLNPYGVLKNLFAFSLPRIYIRATDIQPPTGL